MNKDFLVFKDEDFFKMRFNIVTVDTSEKIIDKFPELKLYPEFASQTAVLYYPEDEVPITWPRDFICRYMLYAYDPMSPFQQIKDIDERKNKALEKAGIPSINSNPLKKGYVKEANLVLKCFFKILNDREYELWQTGNEFFSELTGNVREPLTPDLLSEDKMATTFRNRFQNFKDAIALNAELFILEQKMFSNNEDLRAIIMNKSETNNQKSGKIERLAQSKKK